VLVAACCGVCTEDCVGGSDAWVEGEAGCTEEVSGGVSFETAGDAASADEEAAAGTLEVTAGAWVAEEDAGGLSGVPCGADVSEGAGRADCAVDEKPTATDEL
jgi:hypothetical protein